MVNLSDITVADYAQYKISVDLSNPNSDKISSFGCKLYYNIELVKILTVERDANSIIKSRGFFYSNVDTSKGIISVAWADAVPLESSGNLFSINISAKRPGVTAIQSKNPVTGIETFIFNNGNPAASVDNAEIEIKAPYAEFIQQNAFGNEVNLDLRLINILDAGSLSFRIYFDQFNAELISVNNIYNNIDLFWNSNNGIITLGWYDITAVNPISIADGILCTMKFKANNLSGSLRFDRVSEITDGMGNKLPVKFGDFDFSTITSIAKDANQFEFTLHQNYPNPFNPATTIEYSIPNSEYVSLKVYDILGREVATLVNEKQSAGNYFVDFNSNSAGAGLASGIYFYTLTFDGFSKTNKMILLR